MKQNIVPLSEDQVTDVFSSEWVHQIALLEHSLGFFEKHFQWTQEQASTSQPESFPANDADAAFYRLEIPEVIVEAREALRILRLLCCAS